ncbi:MAG: hypothetical protein LBU90_09655 [Bacteroidales bacterium]|jgi:hypothetical protein|nr:hypothetical protein [Bacteroidales bacterium]
MKKILIIAGILLTIFGTFRIYQASAYIENFARISQYEKGFLLGAVIVLCVGIITLVIGISLKCSRKQ